MSGIDIKVNATQAADGTVSCQVTCNGQTAGLRFTGTEVFIEVPEPAQVTV